MPVNAPGDHRALSRRRIASKAAVEVTACQRFAGWEDPAGPLFSGDFAEQEIAMSDWPPSTNCSACTQSHMRTSRIILCC